MDAQALLTPDAVEREMGRPLAHVPDPGRRLPRELRPPLRRDLHRDVPRARHRPGPLLLDERHLPDRADGRLHPHGAGPGGDGPRDLPPGRQRPAPRHAGSRSSVICPNCGRIGTTIATDWDGETVRRVPRADLVTWATGCGWTRPGHARSAARRSSPWNLEWAAQWSLFGVTIEPCGKDLSTAGGSRDRSDAIAREVFEREPPLNVPYEFLNIGGKKMSTSKGRGAAAHEIVEVIPPEQLRFLFLRPRPNQRDRLRPGGHRRDPAPVRRVRQVRRRDGRQARSSGDLPPGYAAHVRATRCSIRDADVAAEAAAFRPAFGHLALLVQIPNVDVRARVAAEKGARADRAGGRRSSTNASAAARALARGLRAGARPIVAVREDPARSRRDRASTTTSAGILGALADAAPTRRRRPARPGRT